ncbi:AMP-binding protein [Salinactinospora qingdaonensis]|uniref:AMP-binding protein n=1 Tax=Salinactinospora qingdaonensis TaxID=702744 RepID=UPI0031E8A2BE
MPSSAAVNRADRHCPPPPEECPSSSIIDGFAERLRHLPALPEIIDTSGKRRDAAEFASTVRAAATGLLRRGLRPGDVVAVLSPRGAARLTAVSTVLVAGGVALPLEPESDSETLAGVLTETDARLVIATSCLAERALELAERSRLRQVITFGTVADTTPFDELLSPAPVREDHVSLRDMSVFCADSGILAYGPISAEGYRVPTVLHPRSCLFGEFQRMVTNFGVTGSDVVLIAETVPEPDRTVAAGLALWSGASVVMSTTGERLAQLSATRSVTAASPALSCHRSDVRSAPGG